MKPILLLAAAAALFTACGGNVRKHSPATESKQTAVVAPDMHTAQTSLDYPGTYVGTIPAADCPGIEMRLTLKDDGTYALHAKYIDRDAAFDEKGIYSVAGNLLTLNPAEEAGVLQYYKIEENRLRMLDADQQPMTGTLSENYVLTKQK